MKTFWLDSRAAALIILANISLSVAQVLDYSIYGLFAQKSTALESNKVYGQCFRGNSLTTCSPNLADDDFTLAYDREYYKTLGDRQGNFYCVECCGTSPTYIDNWDLSCTNTIQTRAKTLPFENTDMELRMARKKTLTDTEVITCDFPRTPGMYVHGYTVTLTVQQYDSNFNFWRGVSKCSIESELFPYPMNVSTVNSTTYFREKLILKHVPIDTFNTGEIFKMVIIIGGPFVGLYIMLYFLRRKRCEYCQGKLVFSPRLCYKCVIVGAQPPDPVLMKALEERALALQGKPPERFGFVQIWFVGCCRCLFRCFTCQCCCSCCCRCCRFICCCGCFGLCCNEKPDFNKILAEDFDDWTPELEMQGQDTQSQDDDVDVEQGDHAVKPFEEQSGKSTKKKGRTPAERAIRQARIDAEAKEMERVRKLKKNNPNIQEYPSRIIYKAVKHPATL